MAIAELVGRMAQKVADRFGGNGSAPTKVEQDGNAPPPGGSGAGKYGPNNQELKKQAPQLVAALQELALRYHLEGIYARRWEVRRIRYARLFWQGIQYCYWNSDSNDFDFAGPVSGVTAGSGGTQDEQTGPRFEYVTNWYQAYGLSFLALMSEQTPNTNFAPRSRDSQEDITFAKAALDVVDLTERNNDPDDMLGTIGRLEWTDGVLGGYVRYVVDGERFGYKELPILTLGQAGGMDVPVDGGTEKIARGQEVISIVGGLELNVPIWAEEQNEFPWLQWNVEKHRAKLKAQYPNAKEGIDSDSGMNAEQTYERVSRLTVKQNVPLLTPGDALQCLNTFSRTWLRSWAFEDLEEGEVKEELKQLFPDGCYVAFAGLEYCESRNENMDHHWRVLHPIPGDGQATPAVGGSCVDVQERYNILSNLQTETYEYGIPPIYADPSVLDFDALANQIAEPAVHFPARARPGTALADGFFQPNAASEPTTLAATMTELAGPVMQFLSGMLPAVFGGEMNDVKTASGYALARNQAMGRLGLVWRRTKKFYCELQLLAVECFRKNRPEDVEVPFAGEISEEKAKWIRLGDLQGNIMIEPEPDEGMPRLKSQQQAVLEKLLDMGANAPPMIQKMLSEPANVGWMKNVFGLDELADPDEDARTLMMRRIQFLLQSQPLQPPPQPTQIAGPNGMPVVAMVPPPPQASLQINQVFDLPIVEVLFAETMRWANSDAGQTAQQENAQGFLNVYLYAQQLVGLVKSQQKPQSKPPSESMAFKDLPPSGQVQMAGQAGIQLSPDEMQQHADQQRADKAAELQAKLGAEKTSPSSGPQ